MTDPRSTSSSHTSRIIRAPIGSVYRAFTEPADLEAWLVPSGMRGTIRDFRPGVGGGYRMDLAWFEPAGDRGEGIEQEDHYVATFLELMPDERIVLGIDFESPDHKWAGEMTMTVTLEDAPGGTQVTIDFENLPPAITPEDNDAGTRSALEKLGRYLE